MGFFSDITYKVSRISMAFYAVRRLADSLPERIEAFKEGDYVTAFLGEKIGSLFKPQDEKEEDKQTETPEEDKEICKDVPELPTDVKEAMEYDTVASDASSMLTQMNDAAMTSQDAFRDVCKSFEKEAAVDTYMNMITDADFAKSDFYQWATTSTDAQYAEQVSIIVDYQNQIANGTLSVDDVRKTLIEQFDGGTADNPYMHTLSDGTQTSFPPLPGNVTDIYQNVYLRQDDRGIAMDPAESGVSAQYLSEKQAAYSTAIESFTTGYSVEDVLTINALQISDVRSAVSNSVEDEAMKNQILNADYKTPLIASCRGSAEAVAYYMRENPDAFERAAEMNMQVAYDFSTNTELTVANPEWASAASRMREWEAAHQQEPAAQAESNGATTPQRDPALQAETEELANIGQTSTNTVDFGYEG